MRTVAELVQWVAEHPEPSEDRRKDGSVRTDPSGSVTGDPEIAAGHRLTGAEAERIALAVPRLAEHDVSTQTLVVRAVDRGSEWVRSFLTPAERDAIRIAIADEHPPTDERKTL